MSVCLSCGSKEGPTADGACDFCGESASDFAASAMDEVRSLHARNAELERENDALITGSTEDARIISERAQELARVRGQLNHVVRYTSHGRDCAYEPHVVSPARKCTCGLDSILQEIAQEQAQETKEQG